MTIGYLVHNCSIEIYNDPDFFNKPTDIWCSYCLCPCSRGPPLPAPIADQDLSNPLSYHQQQQQHQYQQAPIIVRAHKLFCDKHCLAAYVYEREENPMMMRYMLEHLYGQDSKQQLRRALPFWTMQRFGGPLTEHQYHYEWKQTGHIQQVLIPLEQSEILKTDPQEGDEEKKYRNAYVQLSQRNTWFSFTFNDQDPFWGKKLTSADRVCCWNDGHLITNQSAMTCVKFMNDTQTARVHPYECEGLFCSPECQVSYVRRLGGQFRLLRIFWNNQFDSTYYFQGREIVVPYFAPSRRLLTTFHGPLSIEEFRSEKPRYRVIRGPPIQNFPFCASKEREGYVINEQRVTWSFTGTNVPTFACILNPVSLTPQTYNEENKTFLELYHKIKMNQLNNNQVNIVSQKQLLIHFELMVIEQLEEGVSNKHIVQTIVSEAILAEQAQANQR